MAKNRELPLAQVYGLLEPGPVVLVTTARKVIVPARGIFQQRNFKS